MGSAKPKSRPVRWQEATARALAALEDLEAIRSEYEDWRDNLPENLQESALAGKLDSLSDLDIQEAMDIVQEAADAELPLGFGRD